jgi:transposase-like protein
MKSTRTFTPEYKAKIVIEMLREQNTVSEIGARESISPKQLSNWKKEFLGNAYRAFSVTRDEKTANEAARASEDREQELMAKIGQLSYECDWLKKKFGEAGFGGKAGNARR